AGTRTPAPRTPTPRRHGTRPETTLRATDAWHTADRTLRPAHRRPPARQPGALAARPAPRGPARPRHAALLRQRPAGPAARGARRQRRPAAAPRRPGGRADGVHRTAGPDDPDRPGPAAGLLGRGHALGTRRPRRGARARPRAGGAGVHQVALQRVLPLRPAGLAARDRPRPARAVRRLRPR